MLLSVTALLGKRYSVAQLLPDAPAGIILSYRRRGLAGASLAGLQTEILGRLEKPVPTRREWDTAAALWCI